MSKKQRRENYYENRAFLLKGISPGNELNLYKLLKMIISLWPKVERGESVGLNYL